MILAQLRFELIRKCQHGLVLFSVPLFSNDVKHFISGTAQAVRYIPAQKRNGASRPVYPGSNRNRRACAQPLQMPGFTSKNASQRCLFSVSITLIALRFQPGDGGGLIEQLAI